MARPKPWEVNDELWAVIEPLLPKVERRSHYPARRHPHAVLADHGYDHDKYRRPVREVGIRPLIARHNTEHGSGLLRWAPVSTVRLGRAMAGRR